MTQAQIASGPAGRATLAAPNSQPEPMIEPRPVYIRAMAPTSRRIALSLDMHNSPHGVRAPENDAKAGPAQAGSRPLATGIFPSDSNGPGTLGLYPLDSADAISIIPAK